MPDITHDEIKFLSKVVLLDALCNPVITDKYSTNATKTNIKPKIGINISAAQQIVINACRLIFAKSWDRSFCVVSFALRAFLVMYISMALPSLMSKSTSLPAGGGRTISYFTRFIFVSIAIVTTYNSVCKDLTSHIFSFNFKIKIRIITEISYFVIKFNYKSQNFSRKISQKIL